MSSRSPPPFASAVVVGTLTLCCWAGQASAQCAAFNVAAIPFHTCLRNEAEGFWVSAGAQLSILAARIEGRGGPLFALALEYREGMRLGPWTAATDFTITFRRDGAGPHRDKLIARVCASDPLLVTVYGGASKLLACGDRMTLIEASRRPDEGRSPPGYVAGSERIRYPCAQPNREVEALR